MKTCSKCRKEKPLSEFYLSKTVAAGRQNYCKDCAKWATRRYRYGLSEKEYEQLFGYYDEGCMVCGETESLYIDHDHQSGVVWGWLCMTCNTALGFYESYKHLHEKFEEYLQTSLRIEDA